MVMVIAAAAQVISALAVAVAVGIAVYQLRVNIRTTRARIVAEFLDTYHSDRDMQDAFYALEYDVFRYDTDFAGSEDERKLDKLLGHFNGLARLRRVGILALDDLMVVDYYLCLIMRSAEVEKYFSVLKGYAKEQDRDFLFRFLAELWDERERHKGASGAAG